MNKKALEMVGKSFEELTTEEMSKVQGSGSSYIWNTSIFYYDPTNSTYCMYSKYSPRYTYTCPTARCFQHVGIWG